MACIGAGRLSDSLTLLMMMMIIIIIIIIVACKPIARQ
jgi:hypothetical protein